LQRYTFFSNWLFGYLLIWLFVVDLSFCLFVLAYGGRKPANEWIFLKYQILQA